MAETSTSQPAERPAPAPPPAPLTIPLNGLAPHESPQSPSSSQSFHTVPSDDDAPKQNGLVESPTSDEPPPLPEKDGIASSGLLPSAAIAPTTTSELTPLRAHYLKKELVQLQFRTELRALTVIPANNISTFSYLGPPFTPPPKDAQRLDLPFLRFMFRRFVLSFPFLAAAPKDFFPDKLQPFMASMLSRNLSSTSPLDNTPEDTEQVARYKLLAKLERNFALLVTNGTKLVEDEDVVRLSQRDLDRLELLAKKRANKERKLKDLFEVNVVSVRTVIEKKRVRNKAHDVRVHVFFIYRRRHHRRIVALAH